MEKITKENIGACIQAALDNNEKNIIALQTAYNSEQATISSFKTYALYALIGFVAWAYFGRKN